MRKPTGRPAKLRRTQQRIVANAKTLGLINTVVVLCLIRFKINDAVSGSSSSPCETNYRRKGTRHASPGQSKPFPALAGLCWHIYANLVICSTNLCPTANRQRNQENMVQKCRVQLYPRHNETDLATISVRVLLCRCTHLILIMSAVDMTRPRRRNLYHINVFLEPMHVKCPNVCEDSIIALEDRTGGEGTVARNDSATPIKHNYTFTPMPPSIVKAIEATAPVWGIHTSAIRARRKRPVPLRTTSTYILHKLFASSECLRESQVEKFKFFRHRCPHMSAEHP